MIKAGYKEKIFKFRFPAGTSRGILTEKKSWFLILEKEEIYGIGECSVIPGLSPDNYDTYLQILHDLCQCINDGIDPFTFDLSGFPSIRFGLEMALKDLETGGNRILFKSDFTESKKGIPINGLVWMGDKSFMKKQIKDKIEAGFRCIKMKIGALDFGSELDVLKNLRKDYPHIEIRLDANGAFKADEALTKLQALSQFRVHSLEQPIKPGQYNILAEICESSPIPIALDEELIGISENKKRGELLKMVKPEYIVLKPGLIGGFESAKDWIEIANQTGVGWWVTSALESNIGLNAIAQWVYTLNSKMVQGLGTGQLYENNIPSPLIIKEAELFYEKKLRWNFQQIL